MSCWSAAPALRAQQWAVIILLAEDNYLDILTSGTPQQMSGISAGWQETLFLSLPWPSILTAWLSAWGARGTILKLIFDSNMFTVMMVIVSWELCIKVFIRKNVVQGQLVLQGHACD